MCTLYCLFQHAQRRDRKLYVSEEGRFAIIVDTLGSTRRGQYVLYSDDGETSRVVETRGPSLTISKCFTQLLFL